MGYDIHLVKKGNWFDAEAKFTEREWEDLRARHQIPEWVYFASGDIVVTNPEKFQIIALVEIAKLHGWTVQGDDGETYLETGEGIAPVGEKESVFEPLLRLFRNYQARRSIKKMMKGAVCPFQIGDRVRALGAAQGGVVVEIDMKAHHGIGSFTVKLDNGVIAKTFGFEAHTFQKESE